MNVIDFFEKFNNVDAILIHDEINAMYLNEYLNDNAYYFITKNCAYYLTDSRYTEEAKQYIDNNTEILEIYNSNLFNILQSLIEKFNLKNLGFEDNRIQYLQYLNLTQNIKNVNFVPIGAQIDKIRSIKTDSELEKIKKACDISSIAFNKFLPCVKEGVTEKDLVIELEYLMKKCGANDVAFDTIVAFGNNTSKPHAHAGNNKLKNNTIITIDFGAKYNYYCSDMTRTFVFGNLSKELEKIYNTVLNANLLGIDTVKAGLKGNEVDGIVREYLTKEGYGKYFTHSLGHSLGLEIHENPTLSPRCSVELKENMVETIEPGIYIEGLGGVRIEDTVIIKKDKPIVFTSVNKELLKL